MTLSHPKTVIKREDMARIFEMIESGVGITKVCKLVGYEYRAVKRGIVIAKLLGFEGCEQ